MTQHEKARLRTLIRDAQKWSAEYIRRSEEMHRRKAYREREHYEDLISAHQCYAEVLRKLIL